jgi:DNA repair protein RadA/Sms
MAAKAKTAFFCRNCGFESPKWQGKCPSCAEWNTFTEEVIERPDDKEVWKDEKPIKKAIFPLRWMKLRQVISRESPPATLS